MLRAVPLVPARPGSRDTAEAWRVGEEVLPLLGGLRGLGADDSSGSYRAGHDHLGTRPRPHPSTAAASGDPQRGQLTPGERAADRLRNGMGSWAFVLGALVFLAGWMVGNRGSGFDPYPFILLNLILSCLAAMQGAILLIAARRADQISAELAAHDYAADMESERLIEDVRALALVIQRHVGAPDVCADDYRLDLGPVRPATGGS